MSSTEEEVGQPLQKGSDSDISDGPITNRRCTDILFCLLFIAHIGLFGVFAVAAVGGDGNPEKLIAGQDFQGNFCGLKEQILDDGTTSVENYPYLLFTMNVTSSSEFLVDATLGDSSFDWTSARSSFTSSLSSQNLLDQSGALLNDMGKYFHGVCVQSCPTSGSATSDTQYVWEGPASPQYKDNWNEYVTMDSAPLTPFTFDTLPGCPYEAKYCVPLDVVEVEEVGGKYCVPKIPSDPSSSDSSVTSYVPDSFGETIGTGFNDFIGDMKVSWPATLAVAFISLIVAMIFLLLLRLFVGVLVWVSIFLCFLLLILSGAVGIIYLNKCVGQSLFESAQSLQESYSAGTSVSDIAQGNAECESGKSVSSDTARLIIQYGSYVLFGSSVLYLLLVLCLCKRIRLGIAINKVAAQFVSNNKASLLIPITECLVSIIWWMVWLGATLFTVSYVPEDTLPLGLEYQDFTVAASPAECGFADMVRVKRVEYSYLFNDPSQGIDSVANVYACMQPSYLLDFRFWYLLFSLFWVNAFVIACGQCSIAGAVGVWYFTSNDMKGKLGTKATRKGVRNTWRYHFGTMAFGSLILAIIQTIKWYLRYLSNQAKRSGNKAMQKIAAALAYCVACFERCIKFLNKNAYIQTALMGTNFCTSAKNAFFLILRNAARIGVLAGIGGVVNMLGVAFITGLTAAVGYFLVIALYDGEISTPIGPVIVYVIIGYCTSKLVMNVFRLAVDATLQCFVADEELNRETGGAKSTPVQLQSFLDKQKK